MKQISLPFVMIVVVIGSYLAAPTVNAMEGSQFGGSVGLVLGDDSGLGVLADYRMFFTKSFGLGAGLSYSNFDSGHVVVFPSIDLILRSG